MMAKEICPRCKTGKAMRACNINDGIKICPICCSRIRYDTCAGCSYYETSQRYQRERKAEKKFIIQLLPDIDEECDRALKLAESGRIAKAEKMMSRLLEKYPDYHMVQYGMGVCCALQERTEDAVTFFKKAAETFPYFTEAYFNLGMAYWKICDLPPAITAFKKVIRIGGPSALVDEAKRRIRDTEKMLMESHGYNLDTYLRNTENFKKAIDALYKREYTTAIELFNKILQVDPSNVQSWGNLGLAYASLGNKDKAIECLDRALELDPEYELAIVNRLGIEKMKEGESIEVAESVNYYKDYRVKDKSYIKEWVDSLRAK